MSKIAEMPENEKPRDKAMRYGVRTLSNRELIAILIRTGTEGKSALETADALIRRAGGMDGIARMDIHELTQIDGIGPVKAMQILTCFEIVRRCALVSIQEENVIDRPDRIREWLQKEIGSSMQEKFLVVYLNNQHRIIDYKVLFIGTIDTSPVFPREIFKEALLMNSTDIMLVHNHPSGNLEPSIFDIELTGRMIRAGKLMGVNVLDHIIVTQSGYLSFVETNLMEECISSASKEW